MCILADCLKDLTLVETERVIVEFVPWRSTEGQLHSVSGDRGLDHAYEEPITSLHEDPEPYSAALEASKALPFFGCQTRVFDSVVDAKSLVKPLCSAKT